MNALTCARDGARLAAELFGDEALWIPYTDPGLPLARRIRDGLAARPAGTPAPAVYLLQSHGLIVGAETTIDYFKGFDPDGAPEFIRIRKAMQYAPSLDEFMKGLIEGNNGGYANNWLVGDNKTGEFASLELGLKNVTLRRTTDGYFAGSNFPVNEKLAEEARLAKPLVKRRVPELAEIVLARLEGATTAHAVSASVAELIKKRRLSALAKFRK